MKEIKIAFTGKMRTGKDTAFKLLSQGLVKYSETRDAPRAVHQIAFGDALKEYAHALFPERFIDGHKDRELYQKFGQMMREINPNIWVDKVDRKIDQLRPSGDYAVDVLFTPVITDLRQPNEYKYCKENGFYIIKVTSPDEIRKARIEANGDICTDAMLNHETETHIDGFSADYVINNYRNDLDNLKEKVNFVLRDILKKEGLE